MFRLSITARVALTIVFAFTPTATAQSQASFRGLGDLPGGLVSSNASAVSSDGRFVVGSSASSASGNGQEATRWELNADGTIASMLGLGDLSGGIFSSDARGVSLNGNAIVGTSLSGNGQEAFRWTPAGGMIGLGDFAGGNYSSICTAVSADGSVIAGHGHATQDINGSCGPPPFPAGYRAFQWTAAGGMVSLTIPSGLNRPQTAAWGISSDGSVIGGTIDHEPECVGTLSSIAVRWVNGFPSVIGFDRRVADVSPDGTAFVGATTGVVNGYLWTSAAGFVDLGSCQPQAVSAEGRVVVGMQIVASAANAFIWDQQHGLRLLKDTLINDFGVTNLTGWSLYFARSISDDGLTIVGLGANPSGQLEGWVVRLPHPDTDGDGLLDDWETNGVPYVDGAGAQRRYELNFDGNPGPDCNVNRKDIFVEVDAMVGMAPSPSAYISVKAAFDSAPVNNPNGAASGIKLHIIEDELDISVGDWTLDDTNGNGTDDWPTEFDALKLTAVSNPTTLINGYFGTADDRNFENSPANAAAVRAARSKVFRYCIFGRSIDATVTPPTTGPGGIAEIGGNDFCVTMGLWSELFHRQLSGMFMHELGHTLGLRHGGGDDLNYKPNYYSVMNYAYSTPKQWMYPGTWPLEPNRAGFSKFALPTLNENSLTECSAQVVPGSALAGTFFTSSYVDEQGLVNEWFGRYDLATDWNNNQGTCEDPIAVDINRLPIVAGVPAPGSPGETLVGHDDWAVVDLNFLDSPSFAAGVHNPGSGEASVIDITFEQDQALNNALPPFCLGDVVNDRDVNADDLVAVILAWGACPTGCVADIAPLPANGAVDADDLVTVILNWGPCK